MFKDLKKSFLMPISLFNVFSYFILSYQSPDDSFKSSLFFLELDNHGKF